MLHPAVTAVVFAVLVVMCMAAFHPVCAALALAGGLLYRAYADGWAALGRSFAWQVPFLLIVAVLNPLFVSRGDTVLFWVGTRPFTLEAFSYGLTMGAVLVSALLWFGCASRVLTSDKVMAIAARRAPTVALMLSMALRLVPSFLRRARDISDARRACAAAAQHGPRASMRERIDEMSVLMAWGMEDSLARADTMKARGWGAVPQRTTYRRYRFRVRDGIALAVVTVVAVCAAAGAAHACAVFAFYPTMGPAVPLAAFAPCALLYALPLLFEEWEALRWMR